MSLLLKIKYQTQRKHRSCKISLMYVFFNNNSTKSEIHPYILLVSVYFLSCFPVMDPAFHYHIYKK